jgi:hypothetical protein
MSNRKSNFARAHNISLPSTKRKLNIDEATSALSSMGYRMGTVRHSLADKTSYWSVTTPTGSVVEVAANKLTDFVYGKIKNLNAQRYTETTYEVLFPDEDEDTQFIDSKEAAIKVARQYAAKGCTVELSQVTKTWRSKSEADAAQIPTNTKETPMRFFKGLNMNSTGAKAKFGDYYNNPADSSKKVNKLLPRIVAAIKAAGGQVDSVEKHESKSSASIRFPTKGDYQVSIDIGSTYLAVNRYVIRGAGVLQSVHLFNGELSDIDKAVAIAVNEWKKLKAARRHFSRVGAKGTTMKSINKRLSGLVINELNHALEMAEMDGEKEIAREVRAVLASPTVENLKAHPLAIKEIKYKLEIAEDNEERSRVRAYQNLLKSVSNRKAQQMKKSTHAVVHPSIAGAPLDPYTTKVPILLKDKTTVTAVRNDGRWSIEGRSEMPTSRKFDQLIAELNAAGFTRLGAKSTHAVNPFNLPAKPEDWNGKTITLNGKQIKVERTTGDDYDLFDLSSGKRVKSVVKAQLDDAWRQGKIRDIFSRVGAKARFAVRRPSLTLEQVNEINQILTWYQTLVKKDKRELVALYDQKMKRGNVEFKSDIREMQKPWMAVDIIRTQFRENRVQAAFDASPSGKPLPLPITHARNGAKAKFDRRVELDKWTSPKETPMRFVKNLNAQRYADELIRSLLPFEQEQIRNEGYKVYEVEICMPESGCNHYETVAAKDVRDAVRIGKAHAKGMKFNGVTKVNAKVINNFLKLVINQKAKSMNSETLDPNHPNNFISLFREKYLDDINNLLEDINQPKMFLTDRTSRSKIRNDLDDIMDSATDAGISIPRRVKEAYESARLGHFSRVGTKAKFGEVENLLNMISDQMNSGNNDLAKTNLRKLAAKIGEIRHTRSEWDQFMTVAKSLGFTESQIGGFSRRGSKMTKSTYAISPLQDMANKVQRLNAQYHLLADRAEETKIAANTAYRAYVEAKKILDDAIRSAGRSEQAPPQPERHSRGLSRNGAKAINANVDFKPFHEEMYEYTNGNKPRGRGSWIFVAPDGSLVYAPHGLTYSQAKAWLKKNATINGHYKVAP